MTKQQPDYISYLLRLRRVSGQGESQTSNEQVVWHASLEDPRTGEQHHFASVEEALEFLRAQMGEMPDSATSPGDRKGHSA
jgi:hypothetical protein